MPVANATITPSPPAHQVHTGDPVTLRCSVQVGSAPVTFTWLHDGQEVARGPVLELGDVDVGHSGTYQCLATNQLGQDRHRVFRALSPEMALEVTLWGHGVTVAAGVVGSLLFLVLLMGFIMAFHWWHRMDRLVLQVPALTLLEGEKVTLRCRAMDMSDTRLSHSGHYHCKGFVNFRLSVSAPVTVTVHVPMANATVTRSPLSHQVNAVDPVTLRCSVQVGSDPVTFTWLHSGQEVAQDPVLDLGNIDVGHSGTYQCVATNQLRQDGHRVLQALSPELALEVTPQGHWNRAVAAAVGGSLLFLVLVVGVAVAWHRWNNMAARKHQERVPPDPPAPPEEGEVLYTHVVSTKQMGGEYRVGHTQRNTSPMNVTPTQTPQPVSLTVSPCATTLQDPQVTYAELRGPHGQQRELSDIYGNVL
ncbi:hypothetical protein HGM15179_019757 [Zosterops borbonicus]|uniref:Ig-like domain-containing protein n=1 Tax=Zosterops borbonicus TaxID=364589 RepID=A0A8K1D7K3_9PASS|nr:hypothetical protein HGM15179_019757 [Zosterops borbonicus]